MNDTGYLILIAALFIVASLLLCARFVSRRGEKSLESADADFPPIESDRDMLDEIPLSADESAETVESLPVDPPLEDEEEEKISVPAEPVVSQSDSPAEEQETKTRLAEKENPPTRVAMLHHEPSVDSEKHDEELEKKGEYLDELQEAAAGLAMLMRSSPVSEKRNPVIFAPDEEIDAEVEADDEPTAPVPVVESVADEAEVEEIVAEVPVVEPEPIDEIAPVGESRIIQLLGEEVSEQMDRIDSGLDELEELVNGIESSLAALTLPDWEEEETLIDKAA